MAPQPPPRGPLALLFPLVVLAGFGPARVVQGAAEVDWTNLQLEARVASQRTVGAWKDRRVQEQDAIDQALLVLSDEASRVCVTPEARAADLAWDTVGSLDASVRRDWTLRETHYFRSGGLEILGAIDLARWLAPVAGPLASAEPPVPLGEGATGLLVDARSLRALPCFAPRILGPDQAVLFQLQDVARAVATTDGPARWFLDPADPGVVDRVGPRPLLVRAQEAPGRGLLVLSPQDTAKLASNPTTAAIVSAGRVAIVMDGP